MGLAVGVALGHDGYENGVNGWHSGANSAGGFSIKGSFTYTGEKTIKYITIRFTPYNRVNDAVTCSIKGVSEYGLKSTGPYEPGKSYSFFGENMWYNHSITSVKATRAQIEFMDGTKETIPGSQITEQAVSTGGCYVATAVYGSYDCPQVWTLRRYRDYTLAETWHGRAFIRAYYAISPTLVKCFGQTKWFKAMWRGKLDRMVRNLNRDGVENTPYEDRNW